MDTNTTTFIELVDKRHISIRSFSPINGIKATQLHFHGPEEAEYEFNSYMSQCNKRGDDIRSLGLKAYMVVSH